MHEKETGKEPNEIRPEYDLTKLRFVGRGMYAKRYRSGTNLVLLKPDVRKAFPDDVSVNEALRLVAKAAKKQASRVRKAPARKGAHTTRVRRTG